jgi:HEAT repeat protein
VTFIEKWLDRLKNKQAPVASWAENRRAEAFELLKAAESQKTWADLSTHSNGFVREVAVRALCDQPSPEALVALIDRLNDWVPQVRDLASAGVNSYLSISQAQALLFALEPFMALAARQRADHGPTLVSVRDVLQSPEIQHEVHAYFLAQQGKAARYLFALLLEKNTAPETLLRSALTHRELTVRLAAVTACRDLPVAQAGQLLLEALSQPGAKVRVCIMRALLPLLDNPRPLLSKALLDPSPSIRSLARWVAPLNNVDPVTVLSKKMNQNMPTCKRDWLGVLGLAAELDARLDERWLTQALRSSYATVRHAAVRLLSDDHLPVLLEALDDPSDKVFRAAIAKLDKQTWSAVNAGLSAKLDQDWHELSTARREAMLKLKAGWQQVAYLLERLYTEPVAKAFWLRQINLWCDHQYQVVDPVTSKIE